MKMLQNGSISAYFKYAFGEIALVVVGILIALSINNCNEQKTNRNTEIQIYEQLRNQIHKDKPVVQGVSDYNNRYLEQYQYAHEIIQKDDKSHIDTLGRIAFNLLRYSDYNRSGNVYQTMVNSGQLKYLRNSKIVEGLQNLEEAYNYMNRMEELHFKIIMQFVGPGVIDNVNLTTGKVERPEELFSFAMDNLFISFIDVVQEKRQVYTRTVEEIETLTELIDAELKG